MNLLNQHIDSVIVQLASSVGNVVVAEQVVVAVAFIDVEQELQSVF